MESKLWYTGWGSVLGASAAILATTGFTSPYAWAFVLISILAVTVLSIAADDDETPVDVWAPQKSMMLASGQPLPTTPEVNEGTLLYVALVLEELAETLLPINEAVSAATVKSHKFPAVFVETLQALQRDLQAESVVLRRHLSRIPKFSVPVSQINARRLLDGVTDLAVVVAGLGLASGMPVREAYKIVADSNLSKRNPGTLRIDKDPSGKWIKGANYVAPDARLNALLRRSHIDMGD